MNGKALDYSDYTSTIDIEPGMAKKTDIPAYEHEKFGSSDISSDVTIV